MGKLKMWQTGLIMLGIAVIVYLSVIGIKSSIFKSDFKIMGADILSKDVNKYEIVAEADLAELPSCVQRYLRYTGVLGKEKVNTVRLLQKGTLRQTPEDSWKSITAVEYFSIDPPSFVWNGQMAIGPFSIISARDSYIEKSGHMLIMMFGSKTIGDIYGDEMDYSSLVRYLNEMMWFPTAFLNNNIHWESIDDNSARVSIINDNKSASAILCFDENGALTNFIGERYHEVNGIYVKDTWETPMTDYREFNGLLLPVKGEAIWKMSGGDFSYIRLEVTDIEYNITEIY